MKTRRLYFFITFTLILFQKVHAAQPLKDTAVYLVDGQVMYATEVNQLIGQIKKFQCLSSQSLLLRLLELDKKGQSHLMAVPFEAKKLGRHHGLISKLILYSKLKGFTQGQWGLDKAKVAKWLPKYNCLGRNIEKWPSNITSLMELELYLRDRFWSSDKSLQQDKNLAPIRSFLSSVSSKTEHKLFYPL